MNKSRKQLQKYNQKPKEYRIYGIYDRHNKKLLYVNIDKDQSDLEYNLGDYNNCELITFKISFD